MWRACRQTGWVVRPLANRLGGSVVAAAALLWICMALQTPAMADEVAAPTASPEASNTPSPPAAYISPQTVIQGGTLPDGWTPQPMPYTGVGPDGKPITVMIAPTYVFTLPPQPAAAVSAVAAAPAANPTGPVVTQNAAKPAAPSTSIPRSPHSVPYGSNWVYQTQGVQPTTTSLTRSQPPPLASASTAAWGGSPLGQPAPYGAASTPAPQVAAAAPPVAPPAVPPAAPPVAVQPQQYGAALQPPPTQWGSAVAAGTIGTLAVANTPPPPAAPSATVTPSPVTAAIGPQPQAPPPAVGTPPPPGQTAGPDPPLQATPPPSPPATAGYQWRVVGVVDGDLMTCLDESGGQHKVRLAEIDAPDLGQDYGTQAREKLADYVFGKTVQVVDQGKDRSGRWIARVYVDGVDVNRELVAGGDAWHYAAASSDPALGPLQEQARSRRLGLWAQPDPVAPWEWRQQQ